jgi:hypothetical protein
VESKYSMYPSSLQIELKISQLAKVNFELFLVFTDQVN